MSDALLMGEPQRLTAGDTWQWAYTDASRRSDVHTLGYRIAGPSVLEWNDNWVTPSGAGWAIEVPMASTVGLIGGTYKAWRIFSTSTTRATEAIGVLVIEQDPTELQDGDAEDWLERTVRVLRAVIAGRASDGLMQYMVGRRQVMHYQLSELVNIEARYSARLASKRRRGRRSTFRAVFGRSR